MPRRGLRRGLGHESELEISGKQARQRPPRVVDLPAEDGSPELCQTLGVVRVKLQGDQVHTHDPTLAMVSN